MTQHAQYVECLNTSNWQLKTRLTIDLRWLLLFSRGDISLEHIDNPNIRLFSFPLKSRLFVCNKIDTIDLSADSELRLTPALWNTASLSIAFISIPCETLAKYNLNKWLNLNVYTQIHPSVFCKVYMFLMLTLFVVASAITASRTTPDRFKR